MSPAYQPITVLNNRLFKLPIRYYSETQLDGWQIYTLIIEQQCDTGSPQRASRGQIWEAEKWKQTEERKGCRLTAFTEKENSGYCHMRRDETMTTVPASRPTQQKMSAARSLGNQWKRGVLQPPPSSHIHIHENSLTGLIVQSQHSSGHHTHHARFVPTAAS